MWHFYHEKKKGGKKGKKVYVWHSDYFKKKTYLEPRVKRFRFINESVKYGFIYLFIIFLTLQSVLDNLCWCEEEKSWTAIA